MDQLYQRLSAAMVRLIRWRSIVLQVPNMTNQSQLYIFCFSLVLLIIVEVFGSCAGMFIMCTSNEMLKYGHFRVLCELSNQLAWIWCYVWNVNFNWHGRIKNLFISARMHAKLVRILEYIKYRAVRLIHQLSYGFFAKRCPACTRLLCCECDNLSPHICEWPLLIVQHMKGKNKRTFASCVALIINCCWTY